MTNERNFPIFSKCRLCERTYRLDVRREDWKEFCRPDRGHIQDIFPYLSDEERELLISHTCPDCWKRLFES